MTAGEPDNFENYEKYLVEGISVYIYKNASSDPGGIKIIKAKDPRIPGNLEVIGLNYEQLY